MYILGISAYYHDSGACLLKDNVILGAVQEERFTRKKHDEKFPKKSIEYLLRLAGITINELDTVIFYEKPLLKFDRLVDIHLLYAPYGFVSFLKSMPVWIKDKLFMKQSIIKELKKIDKNFSPEKKLIFSEHHASHLGSAFFPSPFEEAIIITADGVGEWATTSIAIGRGKNVEIKKEIIFPHSLGLLYSALTYYLGFKVNSGEYKVMGLAPYGTPKYASIIREKLITIKDDGSFELNMMYFGYVTGLRMTNAKFAKLFGMPVRKSESELLPFHMDMAASIQEIIDEVMIKIVKCHVDEYKIKNICLAGGVALNCVTNGKLLDKLDINLWIQPASGDAGGALGAAYCAYHLFHGKERVVGDQDQMQGTYLGPEYSDEEIERALKKENCVYMKHEESKMIEIVANDIANSKVIGWFQGRMEFGPRSLGNRSILGDPRNSETQLTMNLKIKFRESFRPFAPSVLAGKVKEWFNLESSPYMLLVTDVLKSKHVGNKKELVSE